MATSIKTLEALVSQMNEITGSPAEPWVRAPDGSFKAQIGNYHLSGAYGKQSVERMVTEGGGVTVVFGYASKPEIERMIRAWLGGYQAVRQ